MNREKKKIDLFLLILTPFLLFLLFWNLHDQYLWYDESQTAILSRSVLKYGYPRAVMEDFSVTTDEIYGPGKSYIAQPWLQNYVCALSFYIFGESNASARILFALFGLFSFYLLYFLADRFFKDKIVSRLSVFIAATCVPFLLHLRQCRYYSLTVFFTLLSVIAYFGFLERKKWAPVIFILSASLLFHANFGNFIPVMAAILAHFIFFTKDKKLLKPFLAIYAALFLLTLPWVFIYKIWIQAADSPESSMLINAKFYLSKINQHFFPYRFLAVFLAAIFIIKKFIYKRRQVFSLSPKDKNSIIFMSIMIFMNWFFLLFADYNSLRYIIHIAVFFFIIEAFIAKRILAWNKYAGIVFVAALSFTNLLNVSLFPLAIKPALPLSEWVAQKARGAELLDDKTYKRISKELGKAQNKAHVETYFSDYLYEITHEYNGPIECVAGYLNEHAGEGDTIKTHDFNANSLFFYTGLNIDRDFNRETYPEWIFLRDYWNEASFYKTDYFKKIEKRYDRIELDCPDIWWENRPDDMSFHYFKLPEKEKKVSLYKRK